MTNGSANLILTAQTESDNLFSNGKEVAISGKCVYVLLFLTTVDRHYVFTNQQLKGIIAAAAVSLSYRSLWSVLLQFR